LLAVRAVKKVKPSRLAAETSGITVGFRAYPGV
jgi:hypothetical protein